MRKLTIDSSVIIASLLEKEPRHQEALKIWESILSGESIAIKPYSVLVEVVAAIRRRTGSEDLACEVRKEILEIENLSGVFPRRLSVSRNMLNSRCFMEPIVL